MANRRLGKYEITERLGRGGMAEVYRGYHASLDRYVAIKVLHAFLADDPEFKNRFEREAQNVAKLKHNNIVQVYDFEYDEPGDSYYMVMELVDGPTLKERFVSLSERGSLFALEEALRIIREAAGALAYAHSRNMIHRDVKPANLMLDQDNRVVLTDFGIAKIVTGAQFTASGGMVGTPAYMAPEQGLGEAGDERSDLYSLGVILYQLVTGQLPYDAETPLAIILKHLNAPIPSALAVNPDLPDAIDHIIHKSIAKEPQDRYQSANEMIEDLERFERGEKVAPASTSLLQSPSVETVEVPRYQDATDTIVPRQPAPRRRFPIWGWVGILAGLAASVYLIGSAAGILVPFAGNTPTPTSPDETAIALAVEGTETALAAAITDEPTFTSSPTLTETLGPTPTASDTPTPTDTLTPTNTLTLTFTPSPTPATPIAQTRRGIVMRIGPENRFPSNGNLLVGDQLDILGVSGNRLWYYVRNQNGLEGWIDASQVNIFGNVADVPVRPSPTNTPSPTPSQTLSPTPTTTLSPTPTASNTPTPTNTLTPTITLTPTPDRPATGTAIAQAAVQASQTAAACIWDYEIISQEPADGDFFEVNKPYERVITLFNTSTCAWGPNTYLRFITGEDFNAGTSIFIQEGVGVGEEYELHFVGQTPARGGLRTGTWQLRTPGGISIGDPIEISVQVFG